LNEMKIPLNKGSAAEEALKAYFSSLGYFVVRSIPLSFKGFDVTDVDLWLYSRSSALLRERVCVDIKRKKAPQAMERILWVKGLSDILRVERCMIATTDNRNETREFGINHGVAVLNGSFVTRVTNRYASTASTLTEESFKLSIKQPCIQDSKIAWQHMHRESKRLLLNNLDYDGCNLLLVRIAFLFKEIAITNSHSTAPIRLLYVLTSYLLIIIDYCARLIVSLDSEARKPILLECFRYGEKGKPRTTEIIELALDLVAFTSSPDLFSRERLSEEMKKQLAEYPAEMLSDYFSRTEVLNKLFLQALEFDKLAYGVSLTPLSKCPSDLKSIIAFLADFSGVERKIIL